MTDRTSRNYAAGVTAPSPLAYNKLVKALRTLEATPGQIVGGQGNAAIAAVSSPAPVPAPLSSATPRDDKPRGLAASDPTAMMLPAIVTAGQGAAAGNASAERPAPRTPASVGRAGATVFASGEAREYYEWLVEILPDAGENLDKLIRLTTRDLTDPEIWAAWDDQEYATVARFLTERAQKAVAVARALRVVRQSYAAFQVAALVGGSLLETGGHYRQHGFAIPFTLVVGGMGARREQRRARHRERKAGYAAGYGAAAAGSEASA